MKIKRSVLNRIIIEELNSHLKGLLPERVSIMDAAGDAQKKKGEETGPKKDAPEASTDATAKPKEQPPEEEPADDTITKDVIPSPEDDDEDDVPEPGQEGIADELAGKTVQSITREPKSKIMPGAEEIVITFDQITDPLRILIGKTGKVAFYFKGLRSDI